MTKALQEFLERNAGKAGAFLLAAADVPGVPVRETMEILLETHGDSCFTILGLLVSMGLLEISDGRIFLTDKGKQLAAIIRSEIWGT